METLHHQSPSKEVQKDKNYPNKPPQGTMHRDFKTIVRVLVGPTKSEYLVHVSHLIHDSPFFAGMLKGNWKETLDGVVKLPADEPIIFECFLDWIYHGNTTFTGTDSSTGAMFFSKAFVFADKIQSLQMKNAVLFSLMNHLIYHGYDPDPNTIKYIYENTADGSRLRLIFVYHLVWIGDPSALEHKDLQESPKFLKEVAQSLMDESIRKEAFVSPSQRQETFEEFYKALHAYRQQPVKEKKAVPWFH